MTKRKSLPVLFVGVMLAAAAMAFASTAWADPIEETSAALADTAPAATEISGETREATSVAIAKESYPDGPYGVIIVRSDNFPDALAAAPLSGGTGFPILMSATDELSPAVEDYIKNTPSIRTALLIGDENALSKDVENRLNELIIISSRISGKDRIATAEKIRAIVEDGGSASDTAIVARSDHYADALSISPFSAVSGSCLFLIDPGKAPSDDMVASLKDYKNVLILGSTDSVSDGVEKALDGSGVTVTRLAGGVDNDYSDNRYGTSAAIAAWSVANLSGKLGYDKSAFATGEKFPDALAGGPMCATKGSVLLLVEADHFDAVEAAAASGQLASLYWLGDTNTLSEALRGEILKALSQTS